MQLEKNLNEHNTIQDLKIGHNQSNNSEITTKTGLSSCSVNRLQRNQYQLYDYLPMTGQHITHMQQLQTPSFF